MITTCGKGEQHEHRQNRIDLAPADLELNATDIDPDLLFSCNLACHNHTSASETQEHQCFTPSFCPKTIVDEHTFCACIPALGDLCAKTFVNKACTSIILSSSLAHTPLQGSSTQDLYPPGFVPYPLHYVPQNYHGKFVLLP